MKKSLFLAGGLAALVACGSADKSHYTVTANLDEKSNGKMAYIIDFDNEEKLDSVQIANNVAIFNGDIPESRLVMLTVDGDGISQFYLEPDSITINEGIAEGGELNKKNSDYWSERMALIKEFRNLPDSVQKSRYEEYDQRIQQNEQKLMEENIDNALGYYYFLYGPARDYDLAQLDSAITAHPRLGEYERIKKIRDSFIKQAETSEGKMFKDFAVTYNDSTFRLSDHVGKGKYVLVDFWASWCGPCIRQSAVVKDIYKEYGPKGLEVIGVAVWDEPQNTLEAIKSHDLPWENVLNAQNIPTDLYGIQGIPCIILFGPDGKILSRDKQNDDLRNDVAKAMNEQ